MHRSAQALNTEALYTISDIKHANDNYKANRPSQILKYEQHIKNVLRVLSEDYVNPFDPNLDKNILFNLSSGIPVEQNMAEQLLGIKKNGDQLYKTFVENRIESTKLKVHDPINREKLYLFKNTGKKVMIKQKEKDQINEVNRQILAKLLAYMRSLRELLILNMHYHFL